MNLHKNRPNFNKKILLLIILLYCSILGILISNSLSNQSLKTSSTSILIYTENADTNNELKNTKDSITASYGAYVSEDLSDYNNLETQLPGHNIFLIPEQDLGGNPSLFQTIGESWKEIIYNFTYNGGIIILLNGPNEEYRIFNSSELMLIDGSISSLDGNTLDVIAPDDPIAAHVLPTFSAPSATTSFITSETVSVVEYNLNPIVIHKQIGNGHLVLMGFDFFEVNADINILLSNSIKLGDDPSSGSIYGYDLLVIFGISFICIGIGLAKRKSIIK